MVSNNPTTNHVAYIFANILVLYCGHQGEADGETFLLSQFHLFMFNIFRFPDMDVRNGPTISPGGPRIWLKINGSGIHVSTIDEPYGMTHMIWLIMNIFLHIFPVILPPYFPFFVNSVFFLWNNLNFLRLKNESFYSEMSHLWMTSANGSILRLKKTRLGIKNFHRENKIEEKHFYKTNIFKIKTSK